jgi:hypothetical protein
MREKCKHVTFSMSKATPSRILSRPGFGIVKKVDAPVLGDDGKTGSSLAKQELGI